MDALNNSGGPGQWYPAYNTEGHEGYNFATFYGRRPIILHARAERDDGRPTVEMRLASNYPMEHAQISNYLLEADDAEQIGLGLIRHAAMARAYARDRQKNPQPPPQPTLLTAVLDRCREKNHVGVVMVTPDGASAVSYVTSELIEQNPSAAQGLLLAGTLLVLKRLYDASGLGIPAWLSKWADRPGLSQ